MSGASTFGGVLLFFIIVLTILVTVGLCVWIPRLLASRKADKAVLRMGASFQAAYKANRDAVDSVITELESLPGTYYTFPQQVREQLDAAHAASSALERKR